MTEKGKFEEFSSYKRYMIICSICYTCKQKTQLTVAAVLSTMYAGLMVVVMVGIIQTFVTNNLLDPSLFFIEVVAGTWTTFHSLSQRNILFKNCVKIKTSNQYLNSIILFIGV